MGQTKIEWAHYTFNIVWGCAKVSPGCTNCYALSESARRGFPGIWGTDRQGATRRTFGEHHWNDPLRWNRKAQRDGVRYRVFCSSMADVCDPHPTTRAQIPRLWELIRATPSLDWLLLTKRPELWNDVLPADYDAATYPHVWIGTSAESDAYAIERVPYSLAIPARVHFVSAEPLLSRTSFHPWTRRDRVRHRHHTLDWIIAGGESGPSARPMSIVWARALRDECRASGIAFFFKQWGQYVPGRIMLDDEWSGGAYIDVRGHGKTAVDPKLHLFDRPGVDRIISGNVVVWGDGSGSLRLRAKHDAGRALDGVEFSQLPSVA